MILKSVSPEWQCNELPDLNLWGHDAVILPACGTSASASDVDILVFGGYGQGPKAVSESSKGHCQRHGGVYCLQRKEGVWSTDWKIIQPPPPATAGAFRLESLGVMVNAVDYSAREGAAVIPLGSFQNDTVGGQSGSRLVGIWGGRTGPQHALSEFLLYDRGERNNPLFVTPMDIRGELPEARWGHSLTRLNLSRDKEISIQGLALLLGGRNTRMSLSTAHVLSLVYEDAPNGSAHFLWSTVSFPLDGPQQSLPFHHATTAVSNADSVSFFVFGGQLDPCNLLDSFSAGDATERRAHSVSSFTLQTNLSGAYTAQRGYVALSPSFALGCGVGGAVTLLDGISVQGAEEAQYTSQVILMSTGAPLEIGSDQETGQNSCALQLMELANINREGQPQNDWILRPSALSMPFDNDKFRGLRESTLVHHRALVVPSAEQSNAEAVLLGGGVMGFSFVPCFSR